MLLQGAQGGDAQLALVLKLDNLRFRISFEEVNQPFDREILAGFVEALAPSLFLPRHPPAALHDQEEPSGDPPLDVLPQAFVQDVRPS